jgi:hypothetical protein
MLIATSYIEYWFTFEAKIANIDISWHIHSCQVSDVYWTIGIR